MGVIMAFLLKTVIMELTVALTPAVHHKADQVQGNIHITQDVVRTL